MANTIISVKDLVKNYGNFQAVKGISFEVIEGEIFGLLGPNGAGKSTTLEIIETLRDKTSGEVWVNGFNPGLNLVELIDLFAGLYNRKIVARDLLKMVNLEDKAKSKFKDLSGGQK